MSPPLAFEHKLVASWPPDQWQDLSVLLAVSGGADSVALLRAMAALKTGGPGRLGVAHFHHGLRGAAADADQAFVGELCLRLSLDFHSGRADDATDVSSGENLEAALRGARYRFLEQTAEACGARYVVTAHTADDQAETVLHHVIRGTGLAGLAGMARARPLGPAVTLIRPLLEVRRAEVLDYLRALNQPFREDASNFDRRFARNRIRHELVPLLAREYAPGVVESLVRLSVVAGDAQAALEAAAERLVGAAVIRCDASRVTLDCWALTDCDRHLVREALVAIWRRQRWPRQDMGYAEWDRLAELALAAVGAPRAGGCRHVFPGAIAAERQGEHLVLVAQPMAVELKRQSEMRQA